MSNTTGNTNRDAHLRGSEKLLSAWKSRTLSEESVREIARALDESPAKVLGAKVIGGTNATGVQLSLSYEGDDVPRCGNDIAFWLKWHLTHGGEVHPPRIIIDGIPYPDILKMKIDFGDVQAGLSQTVTLPSQVNLGKNIGG
jgi:hypothetical protein